MALRPHPELGTTPPLAPLSERDWFLKSYAPRQGWLPKSSETSFHVVIGGSQAAGGESRAIQHSWGLAFPFSCPHTPASVSLRITALGSLGTLQSHLGASNQPWGFYQRSKAKLCPYLYIIKLKANFPIRAYLTYQKIFISIHGHQQCYKHLPCLTTGEKAWRAVSWLIQVHKPVHTPLLL